MFLNLNFEKKWVPPLDYMNVTTTLFSEKDTVYKYLSSLYHAEMMILGNEIGPRNSLELVFAVASLLIGAIITANMFGTMAVLLEAINKQNTVFQEKLDLANTTMKNMKLSLHNQNKIANYLMYTHSSLSNHHELLKFFELLSPSLRTQVMRHLFGNTLSQLDYFKRNRNQEVLDYMIPYLRQNVYNPEDTIIRQGDLADSLYFVVKGEAEVFQFSYFKKPSRIGIIHEGEMFGEIALLTGGIRTASVDCFNYCTVATLKKEAWKTIPLKFPQFLDEVRSSFRKYNDKNKFFAKQVIRNLSLFHNLSEDSIEDIFYSCKEKKYSPGNFILKNCEISDKIFIIMRGVIQIIIESNDDDLLLPSSILLGLGRGCAFNIYSAINSIPSSFTFLVRDEAIILELNRKRLKTLQNQFYNIEKSVQHIKNKNAVSNCPIMDVEIYRSTLEKFDLLQLFKEKVIIVAKIQNSIKRGCKFTKILKQVQCHLESEKEDQNIQVKNLIKSNFSGLFQSGSFNYKNAGQSFNEIIHFSLNQFEKINQSLKTVNEEMSSLKRKLNQLNPDPDLSEIVEEFWE